MIMATSTRLYLRLWRGRGRLLRLRPLRWFAIAASIARPGLAAASAAATFCLASSSAGHDLAPMTTASPATGGGVVFLQG